MKLDSLQSLMKFILSQFLLFTQSNIFLNISFYKSNLVKIYEIDLF